MRKIMNHRLNDAEWMPSPNHSGRITPKVLVMHYTAGFSFSGAVSWLRNPSARASAHIVVGNDARVAQLVPFNVKAWHAGPSRYVGLSSLNGHSIGIEITNVGWLKKRGDGQFYDWVEDQNPGRGNVFTAGQGELSGRDLIEQPHPRVGGGMLYWPTYMPEQLDAVEEITRAILADYPTIEHIVSHEEIDTRGWKTDPGPAFPMQRFKRLLGNDRSDGEADKPESDSQSEVARLRSSLTDLRSLIDAELQRDPPSERHLRWRHAEAAEKAAQALKGD